MGGGLVEVERYYDFNYCESTDLTEEEIIDRLDDLFREAVKLEFEKDKEYGYEHIAELSGGFDSRMSNWVAYELGYKDILDVCFGQSDCMDEKCAKLVSQKLGTKLLVRSLNDGLFLKDYKNITRMNEGASLYSGCSHVYSVCSLINYDQFGLIHTGDLGDAIIGVYTHPNESRVLPGAYSSKLLNILPKSRKIEGNIEKYKMVTRGFLGVLGSWLMSSYYTYNSSPFLYKEFFEFCLTQIPYELRNNHYIYKKWVMKKYPQLADIPVTRCYGGTLREGKIIQNIRRAKNAGISKIINRVLWKVGIVKEKDSHNSRKNDMNPFDLWYESKEDVREDLDGYYYKTVNNVKPIVSENLYSAMKLLYKDGTAIEKTMVITALNEIENLFF